MPRTALLMGLACALWTAGLAAQDLPKRVDYARHIRPILEQHCTACHGEDEQQSGLRLDIGGFLNRGGDRGPAIVPGDSEKSIVVHALLGTNGIERMPQGDEPLSPRQIDLIRAWIDQGARLPENERAIAAERRQSDHWSFQPITRPSVPDVNQSSWPRTPVDAFLLARLEREGLAPSPEADRLTLIRRLSLDLRGLPPTPAECREFLADTRPDAYERLVDAMLASPRYGERWARHWLDLARYADSNGFTIDGKRSIWMYRDWVIAALNADLPFDQFSIEQLAGDLLPEPTTQQLIATGFHRNTLINQEGGTDDEQFRVEAVVDRANTTGAVFLGLTIGCAQCHAHKYDPISQRDFYRVYAVFNNCEDNNDAAGSGPLLKVPTEMQQSQLARLEQQLREAKQALAAYDESQKPAQAAWEARMASSAGASPWNTPAAVTAATASGVPLRRLEDGSFLLSGKAPDDDVYTVQLEIEQPLTAVRLEVLTHDTLPNRGPGLTPHGNFTLCEVEAAVEPLTASEQAASNPQASRAVTFSSATADYAQSGGPVAHAIDGNLETFWGVHGPPAKMNADHQALFVLSEPVKHPGGTKLTLKLTQRYSKPNYVFGRFRVTTTGAPPQSLTLPDALKQVLAVAASDRTPEQQQQLSEAFRAGDVNRGPLAKRVAEITSRQQALATSIPATMILKERDEPRATFIQLRGDFLRPGALVEPGVPEVLPPLTPDDGRVDRLDFAKWLFAPDNPLTARVTVNRHWQRFFGMGIVDTENDFGTQGSPPEHPELLDWLAGEFMRGGWSTKSLHRLIVTSAVYRQASHVTPELLQRDPQNRLLARQSRLRLEAESIRDGALAASGLLSGKLYGPSVFPPQPEGIYVLTQSDKNWKADTGEDRYRRGLYTYFWRSSPYPLMPTFDAPDANSTCTRRNRSNTPLQALTLANDGAFVELAQALALRILQQSEPYDEGRIEYACRLCLGRPPSDAELARLTRFVAQQREYFTASTDKAAEVAPGNLPDDISEADAATWTALARVLMNLDEFVTRE